MWLTYHSLQVVLGGGILGLLTALSGLLSRRDGPLWSQTPEHRLKWGYTLVVVTMTSAGLLEVVLINATKVSILWQLPQVSPDPVFPSHAAPAPCPVFMV